MSIDVVRRCTRNGHTAWQEVARQLGRSVDSVRSEFDMSYSRAHIWAPSREPQPEMIPDPADLEILSTASPYAKGPSLRQRFLTLLQRHASSAQTLASMTGTTLGCAKWQLSVMKRDGVVKHTQRIPYTWSLTEIGEAALRQANGNVGEVAA